VAKIIASLSGKWRSFMLVGPHEGNPRRKNRLETRGRFPRRAFFREHVAPGRSAGFHRQATTKWSQLCLLICFGSLWFTADAMAQQREAKKILILYSHEREMVTYAPLDEGIRSQLASSGAQSLIYYTEYLDLMRFPVEHQERKLVEYLGVKYSGMKVDLIFVISRLAFDFVIKNGDELFPGTPVVFASVNIRTIEKLSLKPNITGIAVKRDIRDTLDVALRLQPQTARVIILVGTSPLEKSWTADLRESLRPYEAQLNITYLSDLPMEDILGRLKSLPSHTVILFSPIFFNDGAGRYFAPEEALHLICGSSNSPVYGTEATYLGSGIVGGHLYNMAKVGEAAGKTGRRILNGEVPANIPVQTLDPNYNVFDARQLKRWGISNARVPVGSIVEFNQPSFWTLYKKYVLVGLGLLLLQSLLVIALMRQALKLRRSESRLTLLSRSLINAQEEERKRIARELHDDFSQRLTLMAIELRELGQDDKCRNSFDPTKLGHLSSSLVALTTDIHHLSHTLHSSKLQYLGLTAALKDLCAQVESAHPISVKLKTEERPQSLPDEIALCFYRIAQEAINNAAKHSGAARVDVALSFGNDKLQMRISDSGKGFDLGKLSVGLGLESMRERMRLINGEFLVSSKPGCGTELIAQVILGK